MTSAALNNTIQRQQKQFAIDALSSVQETNLTYINIVNTVQSAHQTNNIHRYGIIDTQISVQKFTIRHIVSIQFNYYQLLLTQKFAQW